MSDEELKAAAVALVAQYEHTGDELFKCSADAAMEVQARRMAAAPNPYEVNHEQEKGCEADRRQ